MHVISTESQLTQIKNQRTPWHRQKVVMWIPSLREEGGTGEEPRVNSAEQKQSGNPKVETSSAPRAPSGGEAS